jgi:hypothetical protein
VICPIRRALSREHGKGRPLKADALLKTGGR